MVTCARTTRIQSRTAQLQIGDADARIAEQVRERGLVMVEGLGSRASVLAFARRVMTLVPHRHSDPDALTTIQDIGREARRPGLAGLGTGELHAHTEGSSVPEPLRLMLLVCLRRPVRGGEVFLTDGRAVHDHLTATVPEAVDLLSRPGIAFYGDGGGRPSQVFTRHPGGRTSIRYRQDDLAQFSPVVGRFLPDLRAAITAHQRTITLSPGQGYLIDNHRYLHARAAFSGPRLCVRALGSPRFLLEPGFRAGGAASVTVAAAALALTESPPTQRSPAVLDAIETQVSPVGSLSGSDDGRRTP
ncbi:TauD/TfdA family dioxygenase [Streptomyces sp. NPDC056304]|uniref:TauD/TfdA family dioxygenase n=1 Tax=Streptomyces sp. NPDC056304 TaxID=3345778 RepID=UPI0035DAE7C9